MAQSKGPISSLISLLVWLTGILVSLAVGFGMIDGVLSVMWIHPMVTIVAGWVVVILTIVSIILAIADRF